MNEDKNNKAGYIESAILPTETYVTLTCALVQNPKLLGILDDVFLFTVCLALLRSFYRTPFFAPWWKIFMGTYAGNICMRRTFFFHLPLFCCVFAGLFVFFISRYTAYSRVSDETISCLTTSYNPAEFSFSRSSKSLPICILFPPPSFLTPPFFFRPTQD